MATPATNNPVIWATQCLAQGNLPLAEIIAREALKIAPQHAGLLDVLAQVAARLGEQAWAEYFAGLAANPAGPAAPAPWCPAGAPDPAGRFLLIREWGFGFWSEVDHVLGQLLLAELTGRTPIVYWGEHSLFRSPGERNAWESFFRPVSGQRPEQLPPPELGVYPDKWRGQDVLGPAINRFRGADSRMAAMYYLAADEPLAVADFHTGIVSIRDWIRPGHPRHGLSIDALYRAMVARYIAPQPGVVEAVDELQARVLPAGLKVAVHMRGSDKLVEDAGIKRTVDEAPARIDAMLERLPGASIFLLTDDEHILQRFGERYGARLHTTEVLRSDDREGVHTKGDHDPHRLGMEVLTDTLLAARCEAFLGIGSSNLSCMVQYLKDWPEGGCVLLGESLHHKRSWKVHMQP